MALEDILKVRREKLEKLREAGINPYPESSRKNLDIGEVLRNFSKYSRSKKTFTLAGRLLGLRYHGGAVFGDLKDFSGTIQIFFKKDLLGEKFDLLQYLDIGDFLEAEGTLFTTKAGEKTLKVCDFAILAKALRPLPSTWHGLEDVEERFRKRYLDLLINKEVFERFLTRSKIVGFLRGYLEKEGFLEVETPVLQTLYGGATAKPFKTSLDILHLPLYLRIAPELYLKRLLVGGFEKIYEIGKVFRNEGIDREHNPEFTMLELYWAYQDREGLISFVEDLFSKLIESLGTSKGETWHYQGKEISLKHPWPRVKYDELLRGAIGVAYAEASEEDLRKIASDKEIDVRSAKSKDKVSDILFSKLVVPNLVNPTFVIDHPQDLSPLAKSVGSTARRLELYIAARETADGWSELNDPDEQLARFKEQDKLRRKGDEEAHPVDGDFVEALEYGMPPTAGLGIGIDRLSALLTDAPSLKEIILFPFMKPR